jgi:hypothetical protein
MTELVVKINKILRKPVIPSEIILSKFKLLDVNSAKSFTYNDPTYYPFFYYLGREIKPKNVLEIGLSLGLSTGSFFTSCKSVENFLAFQTYKDDDLSYKVGVKNVRKKFKKNFKFFLGNFSDDEFLNLMKDNVWDLILFNEELSYDQYMARLDRLWQNLALDGMLILDKINYLKSAKTAYCDFCKIKNRDAEIFKSKFGSGLIIK